MVRNTEESNVRSDRRHMVSKLLPEIVLLIGRHELWRSGLRNLPEIRDCRKQGRRQSITAPHVRQTLEKAVRRHIG